LDTLALAWKGTKKRDGNPESLKAGLRAEPDKRNDTWTADRGHRNPNEKKGGSGGPKRSQKLWGDLTAIAR